MKELKYKEILSLNKELKDSVEGEPYGISILSNIIVHQSKEILEFSLRSRGLNANIFLTDYDNIIQDSFKIPDNNSVIIFWELSNIVDGLHYEIELMQKDKLDNLISKVIGEMDLIFKNLNQNSLVLFNKFSTSIFTNSNLKKTQLDSVCETLNTYLVENRPSNFRIVEIENVYKKIGLVNSIDLRYYYSSKILYKLEFLKEYCSYVSPLFLSSNGKSKKALIFDCDNTLWGGVLGEDGFDGINMSKDHKNGQIFHEIQIMAKNLNSQGVILGLCTKNNLHDVEEVIKAHPDFLLDDTNISVTRSNWENKAQNLVSISEELNIGLDSMVFIDDSSFEVDLIRESLPEVTVLQVPSNLYAYPGLLRANSSLFYNLNYTQEDSQKALMYSQQSKREKTKLNFDDINDYLSSLELKMKFFDDNASRVERLSQMTQKTNQFNLTTKRYTEKDIENFIEGTNHEVYSFSLSDKFGDNGITGLCVIKIFLEDRKAYIDSFLMSCRVIGRNIEYVFIKKIIEQLESKGIEYLESEYLKTLKNSQVEEFYNSCSFQEKSKTNSSVFYSNKIKDIIIEDHEYIEVTYG